MANNLLDAIQKNQSKGLTNEGSGLFGQPNETGQAQDLIRTGQTGRIQSPGSGPKASNIAEKAAGVETQQGLQSLGQQVQTQQIEQEQQDEVARRAATIQNANLEERRQGMTEQFNRQTKALLDDYKRSNQELDLNRDKARTEQLGVMLRLSNDDYIRKLQAEGQKARLLSDVSMKEAIQRSIFADELDLLNSDLRFRSLLGDKQRDLSRELANIDLDTALSVAMTSNQQANQRQLWEGVGNVATAGINYAASRPKEELGAEDVPEYTQTLGNDLQVET